MSIKRANNWKAYRDYDLRKYKTQANRLQLRKINVYFQDRLQNLGAYRLDLFPARHSGRDHGAAIGTWGTRRLRI